jgi:hypothetical protein
MLMQMLAAANEAECESEGVCWYCEPVDVLQAVQQSRRSMAWLDGLDASHNAHECADVGDAGVVE